MSEEIKDTVEEKAKNTKKVIAKAVSRDMVKETVKKAATAEELERVLTFTIENSLEELIFTEAQSSRYYPGGTLASHLF